MNTIESTRYKAQELAYQAMKACDPQEAARLCSKALEIDPRCVDVLSMMSGIFEDVHERIDKLAWVVGIAAEDLGGESFFEEHKGHFWGMVETRPYMRARLFLIHSLLEAGRAEDAIAHYEAMLELNPGDNQGLRYPLMGLYLETGNVAGVRRLFDEYDEPTAVFVWSRVLERFLVADTDGAEQALSDAREVNSYAESYLAGVKPMPVELPGRYGFGDENEAIVCFDAIGGAWLKHREAVAWLRSNAPQQIPAAKVGRNDPCPCGSGKKYKKCCLGRESAPSAGGAGAIAAEEVLMEIRQAMEGREFSSDEELQSFLQGFNERRNGKVIDDFQGLSARQMHRFLNFPFDSPEIVSFESDFDAPPSAPMLTLFNMLVDAIGDKGLKTTVTGNLPLKFVREAALAYWGEEKYRENTRLGDIRTEPEFSDLHVTRIVAVLSGLVRKYKGRFILSKKCRKILEDGGPSGAYALLLHTYMQKFNWGYTDGFPELSFIQHSFLYTLYQLHKFGEEWRSNAFYEDIFLRAFPAIVDEVPPVYYREAEDTVRCCYSWRALERFAVFAGLAEMRSKAGKLLDRDFDLRKLPLLDQAVKFH
ncbi:MAG: SEC-C metal-binding domain-containing protein [bacterium]|nr:SEC-C metal-binding domain-containing protein [bacterium]